MTTVYLIRHAEAEGNLYRRVHGWYDSLITDNGYRQIAALRGRFADVPIDAVYSSDLFRTMTTATAIYPSHGLELHTDPDLREIGVGVWEDRTWGELERTDTTRLIYFNHSSAQFQVEGGEGFAQVQTRMLRAVRTIAARHPGQTVALFSHGTAIRCLQAAVRGLGPDEMDGLGHSDNTAVTCLEVEGEKIAIRFENDNSHLPEEISTLARQAWWKRGSGKSADANLWFRPLDLDTEAELYLAAREDAWRVVCGPDVPWERERFLANARRCWEQAPQKAIMCAMQGDKMVGLIQMDLERESEAGVGYIPFLYMAPDYRQQGLGVQLIGQAVSTFRPLGRTKLGLSCAPDNAPAQRFYQKYGFVKTGETEGARQTLDCLEKYIGYGPKDH